MDGFGLGNDYGSLVGLVENKIKRYNSAQDLNGTEIKQSLEALSVCILQLFKGGMQTQQQIKKCQRQFKQKARQTKSELNGIREDVAKIKGCFNSTIECTITKFDLQGKETEEKIEKKMQKQKQEAEVLINSGLRKLAIMQKQLEEVKQEKVSKAKILEIIKEEEEREREREREREKQRERERQREIQREREREKQQEREKERERERERERENEFLKNSGKNSWNDLEKITSLYLYRKNIKELPEKLGTLKELQKLYLYSNQLAKLPQSLGDLRELTQFDLSYNQLTELPQSLGNLKELRQLYLHRNQLTKLPQNLGNLTKLEELYLENNQLSSLPTWIGQLKFLKVLSFSKNKITEIPESFQNLKQITWFGFDLHLISEKNIFTAKPISSFTKLNSLWLYYPNADQQRIELIKKECKQRKITLNLNGSYQKL